MLEPFSFPMKVEKYKSDYEVSLNYRVNYTGAAKLTVSDNLVLKSYPRHIALEFKDLVNISDKEWLRPIHPQVYKTYPQAINVTEAVNHLLLGESIEEVSCYCLVRIAFVDFFVLVYYDSFISLRRL